MMRCRVFKGTERSKGRALLEIFGDCEIGRSDAEV